MAASSCTDPFLPRNSGLAAAGHRVYERAVILNLILGSFAILSLLLLLWQWLAAWRFPLHARSADSDYTPPVTLLKSLKGCDSATEACLRTWFVQEYPGAVQILFAVASLEDPVCTIVEKLKKEFPDCDAELIVTGEPAGTNAKVSKLAKLEARARHEVLVISDADVRVPSDFLIQALSKLGDIAGKVGLVNCFYRLANPTTLAMQWEAIAINADFWSQVLQSKSLKPLDFALGAAMVTRRERLAEIGGFAALSDCLADDYQLGNRIARKGYQIELCPVVVECWDPPMTWRSVWKHQLRWARTIRVCQPVPYFFSILSNAGLWALIWFGWEMTRSNASFRFESADHGAEMNQTLPVGAMIALACIGVRILMAFDLQRRMTRSMNHVLFAWMAPLKDLLQAALWFCAFAGNTVEWRGQKFALQSDGTLVKRNAVL